MALACAKQNCDVGRPRSAQDAGVAVANVGAFEKSGYFDRRKLCTTFRRIRRHQAERVGLLRRQVSVNREAILLLKPKSIPPSRRLIDVGTHVVDEREQSRDGTETARNDATDVAVRTQGGQIAACLVQHGDIRVAEAVNGLLPVANDEDGRLERTRMGQAEALAPGLHQQRHELPLCTARVLELVDEDVVISRLEAVPALSEFVHLAQQFERA
jgi:hypothetical protein